MIVTATKSREIANKHREYLIEQDIKMLEDSIETTAKHGLYSFLTELSVEYEDSEKTKIKNYFESFGYNITFLKNQSFSYSVEISW